MASATCIPLRRDRRFILKRTENDKVKTKDIKYDDLGNWRRDIEKVLLTDHQIFSSASNAEYQELSRRIECSSLKKMDSATHKKKTIQTVFGVPLNKWFTPIPKL